MRHRNLFLAITSLLAATGLALAVMFATMAMGFKWHEPNMVIAILEYFASLGLIALGVAGWILVIRSN